MAVPIAATLVLNTRRFVAGASTASKALRPLGAALGGLTAIIAKTTFAITALATAFSAIVIRQTKLTASLVDTSSKLGIGVEFLQKFRYAAEQTGVSTETADMALQRFTRRVSEAAMGTGEAQGALREMGIALRDQDGRLKSTQEVLFEVSDALAETTNSSDKLRLAFKLFDSEGAALVNTLDQGSEALKEYFETAEGLGFVLSQQAAQGVKDFDDALLDLQKLIGGLIAQLTSSLAPVLEEMTKNLVAYIQEMAKQHGGFENFGNYLKDVFIGILEKLIIAFGTLYNVIAKTVNGAMNILARFNGDPTVANLTKDIKYLQEQIGKGILSRDVLYATLGGIQEIKDEFGNVWIGTDENILRAIEILKAKRAELIATGDGTAIMPLLDIDSLLADLNTFVAAVEEKTAAAATGATEEVNVIGKKMGFTFEKLMDGLFGQEKMTAFWNVWDDGASTAIDKLQAGVELVFGKEGKLKIQQAIEPLLDVEGILTDGAIKSIGALNDGLVNFIKTGKLQFDDLGEYIKNTLIQAFVSKAVLNPLMDLLGLGSGGGGGGLIQTFLGLFKAEGGPVSANRPYIVGEQGPELFMPSSAGTIVPNGDFGGGGGGTTVVNYNISAVDAMSFKQMVARDPEFIYSVTRVGARRQPA